MVLGGNTGLNTLYAIAHIVVGVAGAVVTVNRIGDGLTGEPVAIVVGVITGSTIKLGDLGSSARGVQGVIKALDERAISVEDLRAR